MRRPWWWPLLDRLDTYWHIYVCNLIEKYTEDEEGS